MSMTSKQMYRRLNECYEVNFYKGYLQKKTEELKMLPLHKGDVPEGRKCGPLCKWRPRS